MQGALGAQLLAARLCSQQQASACAHGTDCLGDQFHAEAAFIAPDVVVGTLEVAQGQLTCELGGAGLHPALARRPLDVAEDALVGVGVDERTDLHARRPGMAEQQLAVARGVRGVEAADVVGERARDQRGLRIRVRRPRQTGEARAQAGDLVAGPLGVKAGADGVALVVGTVKR